MSLNGDPLLAPGRPVAATDAAGALLSHRDARPGFWLGLVSGATESLCRVRLHLESEAAWKGWPLGSVVAGHPEELTLLLNRVSSGALAECPLTWVEIGYDPGNGAAPDWDDAWYDFILQIELSLSDLIKTGRGALVLAAPVGLLRTLERDAPVLWRTKQVELAVAAPSATHWPDLGGDDEEDDGGPLVREAETAFTHIGTRRMLPAARLEPRTLPECIRVGRTALADGDIDAAFGALTRAAEIVLRDGQDTGGGPVRMIASALVQLGRKLEQVSEWDSAEQCYKFAVDLRLQAMSREGSSARGSREMLVAMNHLADAKWARREVQQATDVYAAALALARNLLSVQPDNERAVRDLLATGLKLGDARRDLSDTVRAETAYEEAVAGLRGMVSSPRLDTEILRLAVLLLSRLADMQRANGKLKTALETYRERARLEARLAVSRPQSSPKPGGSTPR